MTEPTPKNATTKYSDDAFEEMKEEIIDKEKNTDNNDKSSTKEAI